MNISWIKTFKISIYLWDDKAVYDFFLSSALPNIYTPARLGITKYVWMYFNDIELIDCVPAGLRPVGEGCGAPRHPRHSQAGVGAEDREAQSWEWGGDQSHREAPDPAEAADRVQLFEE